jgi:hypothetical protein
MAFDLNFQIQTKNPHRPVIRVSSLVHEFEQKQVTKPTTLKK